METVTRLAHECKSSLEPGGDSACQSWGLRDVSRCVEWGVCCVVDAVVSSRWQVTKERHRPHCSGSRRSAPPEEAVTATLEAVEAEAQRGKGKGKKWEEA